MSKKSGKNKCRRKSCLPAVGLIGAVTALAGATAYGVTKMLVNTALDRDPPKLMQNSNNLISGSPADPEFDAFVAQKDKELREMPHEDVEITAADGIKLKGHWYHKEGDKRVILAMHGWRSSWTKDFGAIADFFFANDCSVLFAEQRGQNDSGGEMMGFGLVERFDCFSWASYLAEKTDGELPIYLAGVSMGAATVLMTAGFDLPNEVHGIIADCGFTSPYEIWKHISTKNLHIPFRLKGHLANALCKKKISMAADDYSTVEALKNASVPVLFIHGTADKFVPVQMTFDNYAACASEKRLLLVPDAGHAMSYLVDKQSYENAVTSFFRDFD